MSLLWSFVVSWVCIAIEIYPLRGNRLQYKVSSSPHRGEISVENGTPRQQSPVRDGISVLCGYRYFIPNGILRRGLCIDFYRYFIPNGIIRGGLGIAFPTDMSSLTGL
ncbi:MAG: hypothetical protein HYZ54_03435 [Ignavibacteriae bacterium]|nr:hypothetical protein [Ignavibacteriota bacterium]